VTSGLDREGTARRMMTCDVVLKDIDYFETGIMIAVSEV
jgi:hypothetical protein